MLFDRTFYLSAMLMGLSVGVFAESTIPLNASMPPVNSLKIAALSEHTDRDEGVVKSGLELVPVTDGGLSEYDWVYSPGEALDFSMTVPEDDSVRRIILTVWDWFGKPVAVREFSQSGTQSLTFDVSGNGTWLLTLDTYTGDSADTLKSRLFRSFSVLPSSADARGLWKRKNQYVLGSCFYPYRYFRWGNWKYPDLSAPETIDRLAGLMARAGFQFVRIDYFPDAGGRDRIPLKETLQILRNHGIGVDWKIDLNASVFVGDTLEFDPKVFGPIDRNLDVLISDFWNVPDAGEMMVEIGNEPALDLFWSGTYGQYVHLYSYLYDKIRAANPDIQVVHGGACYPGADVWNLKKDDPKYLKKVTEQTVFYDRLYHDIGTKGDFWPYHFHGGVDDWVQLNWIAGMKDRLLEIDPALRLFQTEGGHCSWRPDIEVEAWMSVIKKTFFSMGNDDGGWLQFALTGVPAEKRTGGAWGLLHSGTLAPRFQYGAWAAMTRWFAGCTLEQMRAPEKEGDRLNFVYVFRHPEGRMICFFSEEEQSGMLRIKSDAVQILAVDPMGNAVLQQQDDLLAVPLKKYPQYFLLKDAKTVEMSITGS